MYRAIAPTRLVGSLLLSVFVMGCSLTRTPTFKAGETLPSTLAVLPSNYTGEIPRERIDLVRNAIVRELRNKNFVVVEDRVISSACSSPTCPERAELAKNYLVEAFVTLDVSSFSRNNFIAGYYNQLEGSLTVANPSGEVLAKSSLTESESGGVLLQSGQIIQGIISQAEHTGDTVFDKLADKFAKSIADSLPPPRPATSPLATEGVALALQSVSARWLTNTAYSVCAKGTPHSFAYLVIDKTQTSLRETSPGSYCGVFSPLVAPSQGGSHFVELRTAFGNSLRKEVELPTAPACDLTKRVALEDSSRVTIKCAKVGGALSEGCSSNLPTCVADKIVLYQAPSEGAGFRKVTEARQTRLKVPPLSGPTAVVAISPGGIASQPLQLQPGR
jgi:hypothetical protein